MRRRDFAFGVASLAGVAAGAPEEAKLSSETQRQYDAIVERYGARLSEAEKADVRRLLVEGAKGLQPPRDYPLANSNEPATPFRVWRADRS